MSRWRAHITIHQGSVTVISATCYSKSVIWIFILIHPPKNNLYYTPCRKYWNTFAFFIILLYRDGAIESLQTKRIRVSWIINTRYAVGYRIAPVLYRNNLVSSPKWNISGKVVCRNIYIVTPQGVYFICLFLRYNLTWNNKRHIYIHISVLFLVLKVPRYPFHMLNSHGSACCNYECWRTCISMGWYKKDVTPLLTHWDWITSCLY